MSFFFGAIALLMLIVGVFFDDSGEGLQMLGISIGIGAMAYFFYWFSLDFLPEEDKNHRKALKKMRKQKRKQDELRRAHSTESKPSKLNMKFIKSKIIIGVFVWLITSVIGLFFFNIKPNTSITFGGIISLITITLNVTLFDG